MSNGEVKKFSNLPSPRPSPTRGEGANSPPFTGGEELIHLSPCGRGRPAAAGRVRGGRRELLIRILRLRLQHGLRGGQAGDGNAEGARGNVAEAGAVAEFDGLRIAAVLAADADLQILLHLSSARDRVVDQFAHAGLVEGL